MIGVYIRQFLDPVKAGLPSEPAFILLDDVYLRDRATCVKSFNKKPDVPNHPVCVAPNIIPKPMARNASEPMEKSIRFLNVTNYLWAVEDSDVLFGRLDENEDFTIDELAKVIFTTELAVNTENILFY